MRVGILTFPHSPSYGASLQMHALYKAVQDLGATPVILNYQNRYMQNKNHFAANRLKAVLMDLVSRRTKSRFRDFEGELGFCPARLRCERDALVEAAEYLDRIIVGSDQVWNPAVTGGDTAYYLDFCPDEKKVSYAASFGVSRLEEDFADRVRPLLSAIPSLSVREEAGRDIVAHLTEREAKVVLDPTFLLTREDWRSLAAKRPLATRPYIFSFIFNPNAENTAFRDRLARETGLPVLTISDNPFSRSSETSLLARGVGPSEFLRLIMDASYVVTDSFHGTALSILLNRPFFVTLSTKTNSRLETLLSRLSLSDRILAEGGETDVRTPIDYECVNRMIAQQREDSLSFLRGALFSAGDS